MAFPLLKVRSNDPSANLFTIIAMVLGVACGVKATMVAGIALVPLFLLFFLNASKTS